MRRLVILLFVICALMWTSVARDNAVVQAAFPFSSSRTLLSQAPNVVVPQAQALRQPNMTRLQFANFCAAEMGAIPAFKCSDGAYLAITIGGVSQTSKATDCDKPVQLEHK